MFISRLLRERRRSATIRQLRLLDQRREAYYNTLVADAAHAFGTPIAAISIFEDGRQWFKAAHGLQADVELKFDGIGQEHTFCSHALDRPGLLEVCDAQADDRFTQNPFVIGEPQVRYYLGAPLRLSSGVDVGAICVLDTQSRLPASAEQRAYLRGLARQVALELEERADVAEGSA